MICTRRYQSKIMESHIIAYGIAIIILIMFSAYFFGNRNSVYIGKPHQD